MQLRIVETPLELGEAAANHIETVVRANPNAVLGLATGSSPLPVYAALALRAQNGLDFANVRGFALDEYVGLAAEHEQCYRNVIQREILEPLGMNPELMQVPNGCAEDLHAECANYERAIKYAGGIDLQILGMGSNGHIGFNEPGSSATSETRVVELAVQTRQDNARFFENSHEVPQRSITQGIGTILRAREVLLVVSGDNKATALRLALCGPPDPAVPASLLRSHSSTIAIVDRAAASELPGELTLLAEGGRPYDAENHASPSARVG
ncbi:MAG TPA: glucosamine-6-phosphate deaminase [Tepidisphaeraceae bacterium]|nr:glucosamine-6-phosphate deaminase [Tepidisphaeraceae bacterium]